MFLDLPDLAVKLIDAGANVNTANDYGETPLTLALANGNVALSEHLLKAGADRKVTRWNGETALMIAAGAGSVEEVKMLLDAGVDVNGAEPKRQNALMWAASEGHPDVVDLLIQRGRERECDHQERFHGAGVRGDEERRAIRLLLKAGADPNYALPDEIRPRS